MSLDAICAWAAPPLRAMTPRCLKSVIQTGLGEGGELGLVKGGRETMHQLTSATVVSSKHTRTSPRAGDTSRRDLDHEINLF